MVGGTVGVADGVEVDGALDGRALGVAVGSDVGRSDGRDVGSALGSAVGSSVGAAVGNRVGSVLGLVVGATEQRWEASSEPPSAQSSWPSQTSRSATHVEPSGHSNPLMQLYSVGAVDGDLVGARVCGAPVGGRDGSAVLGASVGGLVGNLVGDVDGTVVGTEVRGASVGRELGRWLGPSVGPRLGDRDGAVVGAVGAMVGAGYGAMVGVAVVGASVVDAHIAGSSSLPSGQSSSLSQRSRAAMQVEVETQTWSPTPPVHVGAAVGGADGPPDGSKVGDAEGETVHVEFWSSSEPSVQSDSPSQRSRPRTQPELSWQRKFFTGQLRSRVGAPVGAAVGGNPQVSGASSAPVPQSLIHMHMHGVVDNRTTIGGGRGKSQIEKHGMRQVRRQGCLSLSLSLCLSGGFMRDTCVVGTVQVRGGGLFRF